MQNTRDLISTETGEPWIYGNYSLTLVRFNKEEAQILRQDTNIWTYVLDPSLYRRIVEECDIIM
jgi:hypothetical protein